MLKFNRREEIETIDKDYNLDTEINNIQEYNIINSLPCDFYDEKSERIIKIKGLLFTYKGLKLILHKKEYFGYVSEYYTGMFIAYSLAGFNDVLYEAFKRIDKIGLNEFKNKLNQWEHINS
jgi:hypothetical protein